MKTRTDSLRLGHATRIALACWLGLVAGSAARWDVRAGAVTIQNGDINGDGAIDISDPVAILSWLFLGAPGPVPATCDQGTPDLDNGDANGDGTVDLSDAVHLLTWLFSSGGVPVEIHCRAPSSCLEKLDELGITWTQGPESPGVTTPVTVTLPLGGLHFRSLSGNLRTTWFMDCELAVALHRMAQLLTARGVVEAHDLGIYNYRCIGGGTPPDCPGGISMHAYALAVDIAALVVPGEEPYSMQEDWLIDADGATCSVRERAARDAFLHQALCDLYDAGIFTIHLSPNYNADHRNHWHLDLTPDMGRFLR
jgi:hypothetical protein